MYSNGGAGQDQSEYRKNCGGCEMKVHLPVAATVTFFLLFQELKSTKFGTPQIAASENGTCIFNLTGEANDQRLAFN
jgi:hypothetical protein